MGIPPENASAKRLQHEVDRLASGAAQNLIILYAAQWMPRTANKTYERPASGDPLSSYLFITAMDVLNRIFDLATEDSFLSPLKGCQARLKLSLYADDVVIFTDPKREDCR